MQILHIIQWPAFFFSDVSLARITDIGPKSDEELQRLKSAGFDGLTIGMETADGAKVTAEVCNQLHPRLVGANMLIIWNAVQLYGVLPKDKAKLLAVLDEITGSVDEKELEHYRKNLRHL